MFLGSDGSQDDTPFDGSGLILKNVKTMAELNDAEFKNISKATFKYLAAKPTRKRAPFTYQWMLKLHREMFGDVWSWAGEVRRTAKTIGILPEHIPTQLAGLDFDIAAWDVKDPLSDAVTIHHRAVAIHPFENGNGRWARLLSNIWLKRHGHPLVQWEEANFRIDGHSLREQYIDCLRAADRYDYGPLIELHKQFLSTE